MKFLLRAAFLLAALLPFSCSEYDDSSVLDRLDKLEGRVAALEKQVAAANTEIASLKTLLDALAAQDVVTSIRAIEEDGKTGWEVTFSKSGTSKIFINLDSAAPKIGVKDVGGVLYWTVNGEFLLDDKGQKIQASATNGTNGTNGTDGVTPKLKIEGGYWYVSYDGEKTWVKLGAATAGSGSGVVFRSVEVVGGNVVFTLTDGTVYTIPLISVSKTSAFDDTAIVASFGVISDTHIGNEYGSEAKFTSALTQLKGRAAEKDADGLDAVLVVGDLVNTVSQNQISTFKTLYEAQFDPTKVPMIYTIGNHDMNPGCKWSTSTVSQNAVFRDILGGNYFLTDQDNTARINYECRHCVVGDYHIVCITPNNDDPVLYDYNATAWLDTTLKSITDADPDHYVLLLTHPMIYNTVYGSTLGTYWYTSTLTSILSKYPQVVTFGGHLHFPLNDPRSIWQGAFTSLGCASVSYMAFEGGNYINKAKPTVLNDAGDYSEGLLVQFDASGNMRATRMDFYRSSVIGKPWETLAPKADKSHLAAYNHSSLSAANTPPSLSTATVENGVLTFAAGTDDEFVHHYEIKLNSGGATLMTTNIMSDFYRCPQTSQMKDSYSFPIGQFGEGNYTAVITAYDSWGAASTPLEKEFSTVYENVADVTPYLGTYSLNCKIFEDGVTKAANGTIDVTLSASGQTPNNISISGLFQDTVLPARLATDPATGNLCFGLYFDGTKGQALTTPITQSGTNYGYVAYLPGLGQGFVSGGYNFTPCPISDTSNQTWWWGSVSDGPVMTFNTNNKQALVKSGTSYYIIAISCVLSTTENLSAGNLASTWKNVYQANPGDNVSKGMTFTKK